MKKISLTKIMVLILSLLLFSCNKEDDNYKAFNGPQEALLFNKPTSVLEVTALVPSFIEVLVSTTTVSTVDRVIPITVSPFTLAAANQYSIDLATAVIPAGKNTAFVKILSGNYASLPVVGGVNLVLVLGSSQYVLPNRSNHVVTIQRGCLDTRVNFKIDFDNYASEISWTLRNSSNTVVASSGIYADGLASFSQQFCLTPGTYRFKMDDIYGDGLYTSPSISGTFSLKLLNGTVLASGGGNFLYSTGFLTFTII